MEALRDLRAPRRESPCLRPWQKVGGCSGVGLAGRGYEGGWGGGTTQLGQSKTQIAAHISILRAPPEAGRETEARIWSPASAQPRLCVLAPWRCRPGRRIVLSGYFDLHGPATPASAVRGAGGPRRRGRRLLVQHGDEKFSPLPLWSLRPGSTPLLQPGPRGQLRESPGVPPRDPPLPPSLSPRLSAASASG